MMKLSFTMILLFLILSGVRSQTYSVGDSLPDGFFTRTHIAIDLTTGEPTTVTLADHHDKLIILYFWFNGCAPCIRSFDKCENMRGLLNEEDYIVIPFTYQTLETTRRILNRHRWSMSSIVSDQFLYQSFAGVRFRNMVWIKNGRVYATPETKHLTPENILKVVSGQKEAFPLTVPQANNGVM